MAPFPVKTVVNVLVEKAGDSEADNDDTDANAAAGGVREAEGDEDDVAERGDVSSLIIEGEDEYTFEDEDPLEVSATPKDLKVRIFISLDRASKYFTILYSNIKIMIIICSSKFSTTITALHPHPALLILLRVLRRRRRLTVRPPGMVYSCMIDSV